MDTSHESAPPLLTPPLPSPLLPSPSLSFPPLPSSPLPSPPCSSNRPDTEVFRHYVVLDLFILIVMLVYSLLCLRSIVGSCILTKVRTDPLVHTPATTSHSPPTSLCIHAPHHSSEPPLLSLPTTRPSPRHRTSTSSFEDATTSD